MVPGEGVYGEKRVSVEVEGSDKGKVEYRIWNPFRSKLAAAVLGGVDKIHMPPGSKVLYLGAASGTSVSHVSDIVGPVSTFKLVSFYDAKCQGPGFRKWACIYLINPIPSNQKKQYIT